MNILSDEYIYYKKGKLYFLLSNDNANIYIAMKIEDTEVQNRILNQGLTIWVNMDKKPIKKMGIRFPVGSQNSTVSAQNNPHDNIKSDGLQETPLALANTIELIGFKNEEVTRFPSNNIDNFRGSVKYDKEGTLHYYLVMPVAKLPFRNSKEGKGTMPFTFGIEYPDESVTDGPGDNEEPPAFSESPSGGSRSGSRGGGKGATGGRNRSSSKVENDSDSSNKTTATMLIWIKNIELATDR